MERYSKEALKAAVASSVSMAGVLRILGLKQAGGTQSYVKSKLLEWGISTEHFRRQSTNSGPDHKGGVERKTRFDLDGKLLLYCTKCDSYKEPLQFGFKSKAKGTRQSRCKECHKAYAADHYVGNKDAYAARSQISGRLVAQRNREWLHGYKTGKPCMDCDLVFHPCAMDFDHRVGEHKKLNVSRLVSGSSLEVIQAEISKCDLVCSNCHRVRTYNRYHARKTSS